MDGGLLVKSDFTALQPSYRSDLSSGPSVTNSKTLLSAAMSTGRSRTRFGRTKVVARLWVTKFVLRTLFFAS